MDILLFTFLNLFFPFLFQSGHFGVSGELQTSVSEEKFFLCPLRFSVCVCVCARVHVCAKSLQSCLTLQPYGL